MRKRYVYRDGKWVDINEAVPLNQPLAPMVWGDLPGYESPVTGEWVEGRAQRREDLARSGCRPFEGIKAERAEAQRQQQYQEAKLDKQAEAAAWKAWYQLDPRKREILRGVR